MIGRAHLVARCARVAPDQVKAMLRAGGWELRRSVDGSPVELWSLPHERRDLKVLNDTSFDDYGERVLDACVALAERSAVEVRQVVEDALLVGWDTVRFRSKHPTSDDGTIPLDAGEELYLGASSMLVAAALSTHQARARHPAARPKPVAEYKSRLRLGQTEVGSYVVKILSPVRIPSDPIGEQIGLFDKQSTSTPFGRRVTETLGRSLHAVKSAAQEAQAERSIQRFVDAVEAGVSANLLDALVDAGGRGSAPFEVATRWSALIPAPTLAPRIEFGPRDLEVIDVASAHFRRDFPTPDTEVEGYIVRVNRESAKLVDEVLLASVVNGKLRKIQITLSGDVYRRAISALDNRSIVRYRGTLDTSGRLYVLKDPEEIPVGAWPEPGGDDPVIDDEAPPPEAPKGP